MKKLAIPTLICTLMLGQKVTETKTDKVEGSAFTLFETSCGGLQAEIWTAEKGWHKAECMEMAAALAVLRDFRNVVVQSSPNVSDMLTYEQYGSHFKISRADFKKAQANCSKLLSENFAHPAILAQCRETVRGVVPYGLKLVD